MSQNSGLNPSTSRITSQTKHGIYWDMIMTSIIYLKRKRFVVLILNNFFIYCGVCVHTHVCVRVHMRSVYGSQKSHFSPSTVKFQDQTWISNRCSMHFLTQPSSEEIPWMISSVTATHLRNGKVANLCSKANQRKSTTLDTSLQPALGCHKVAENEAEQALWPHLCIFWDKLI